MARPPADELRIFLGGEEIVGRIVAVRPLANGGAPPLLQRLTKVGQSSDGGVAGPIRSRRPGQAGR